MNHGFKNPENIRNILYFLPLSSPFLTAEAAKLRSK